MLNFFKTDIKYNATLFGVVPKDWRDLEEWSTVFAEYKIISPWMVGAYSTGKASNSNFFNRYLLDAAVGNYAKNRLRNDIRLCKSRGQKYFPNIWPGLSKGNTKRDSTSTSVFNATPRRGGAFLWHQVYSFFPEGADGFYGAMFDEVDEGTAIFKIIPNLHHPNAINNTNG